MKKTGTIKRVGIERKYLRLILIVIALEAMVFVGMILIQVFRLSTIVRDTNKQQADIVTSFSEDTLQTMIERRLASAVESQSETANLTMYLYRSNVEALAHYTEKFLSHSGDLPDQEVKLPDPALEGQYSMQLVTEEGVDIDDASVKQKILDYGGLSDVMLSLLEDSTLDSLYVAFPDGFALIADTHPSNKLTESGEVIHIPIREREWYQGAAEQGETIFTDIFTEAFTGKPVATCATPVYVNGALAAVVASDVDMSEMKDEVDASYQNGEFLCYIGKDGKVAFSPLREGILGVNDEEERVDLRHCGIPELEKFLEVASEEQTGVVGIEIDGKEFYMVGSPVGEIGWISLYAMSVDIINEPTVMTTEQIDEVMSGAVLMVNREILLFAIITVLLLVAVLVLALFYVRKVSGRIVKPLGTMTGRITAIKDEDLLFTMEDTYRTGDEIELLAESFSDMSARTLRYVDQVKTVTAEKERIGAELGMATAIQASQLPRVFPPYPDRREFDLFASMKPAKEVGGDFYDFYLVDDDHIALIMADVSGKGVPAALFMMMSRILIKAHLLNGESPGEALGNTNDQLCENNEAGLFVTVWAAVVELSTGKGVSVNAGHEHPALRKGNGQFELVEYEHSLAVAAFEGVPFDEREFTLQSGDCLFVYTDGVPEAQNEEKELFTEDRLLAALNREPAAGVEKLIENVAKGIESFVDGAEQFDDTTMLCFQYNGPV